MEDQFIDTLSSEEERQPFGFGRPPFGRPPFGRPPFGRPPFGRPPFGFPWFGFPWFGFPWFGFPGRDTPWLGSTESGFPVMAGQQGGFYPGSPGIGGLGRAEDDYNYSYENDYDYSDERIRPFFGFGFRPPFFIRPFLFPFSFGFPFFWW